MMCQLIVLPVCLSNVVIQAPNHISRLCVPWWQRAQQRRLSKWSMEMTHWNLNLILKTDKWSMCHFSKTWMQWNICWQPRKMKLMWHLTQWGRNETGFYYDTSNSSPSNLDRPYFWLHLSLPVFAFPTPWLTESGATVLVHDLQDDDLWSWLGAVTACAIPARATSG